MQNQQKYDIKDLRLIAEEIKPGLNVYSQILDKIADRIETQYTLATASKGNPVDAKNNDCKFCNHLAYCVCE